jgi:hypothetical protein
MNQALLSAFDHALDQPVWNRILMLLLLGGACCGVLYFFLLSAALQQRQEAHQQSADLQQAALQQQKTLLTQPALAVLLQQLKPLVASSEQQPVALLEQIAAPLRESKSTLVQWQPAERGVSLQPDKPSAEQGSLSVKASFEALMVLMRQLADSPNAPSWHQLSLRAVGGQLEARFDLTAERLRPKLLAEHKKSKSGVRDPFAPTQSASCPDPIHSFKGVLLGGIIGSGDQRKSWLMWPGAGWQKTSTGWRDAATGWRVDAVTPREVLFDLDQPPCAAQQFSLQLGRQ